MKAQIKSLLIPTDFSSLSENALRLGISIAKRQHATITLLHVVERFSYMLPAEAFLPDYDVEKDIVKKSESNLKSLAERIMKETGVIISWMAKVGIPYDEICKLAHVQNISLIVMGTHGTSGLREFFIGSEAFRVVKNATVPVLTVPGNWPKTNFARIVFPIRLLPGALEKYFFARPIIEKNNSELLILGLSDMKKTEQATEISKLIQKLKKQLDNDNIQYETALCPYEDFPDETIKIARDYDADLIVLTANLDYDLKAYLVGPFTQQVINHSRLPVLSIKPQHISQDQESFREQAERWGMSIDFKNLGIEKDE